MANIGFISLGCAKNQVDCERMMYRVQEAGFTVLEDNFSEGWFSFLCR